MSGDVGRGWRSFVSEAKEFAREVADDPRAQRAKAKAAEGASVATDHLDVARRKVTQEQAWDEVTVAIEELVDVVMVQQKLIEDLWCAFPR